MPDPANPVLHSARLRLERLGVEHAAAMVAFHRRNRTHLKSTSPPRPEGFYEPEYWRERGAGQAESYLEARSVCWVMLPREDPSTVIGSINFNEIIRGPFRACFLGYALDEAHVGQG